MPATLFDGVTVTIEIALSASTDTYGVFDSARFDIDTFGPEVDWEDVSSYVQSIKIDRKFDREVQTWTAGTATVVLNNQDGRFSPDNLSGPYVLGGVTQVRPLRPVRILATYAGTTYYLYYGYALDWLEDWTVDRAGKGVATCTVPCSDEWSRIAADVGAETAPQGAGETSGQRIHRILNANSNNAPRNIEAGSITVQATTLSGNRADEIKLVTKSEGGGSFIDADGTVCFEQQFALIENTRSNTVQATFGDAGVELKYGGVQTAFSGDLIKNIANFKRVGGTEQIVDDPASVGLNGPRQETETALICESDVQVLALAEFFVARFAQPEKRITGIDIMPRRSPSTLFPQILGRRVRDLVRVKRQPPGGHTVTRDCHIAGIHHVIVKSTGTWEATFDLWSATVYTQYATSRFDLGEFDEATFFFGSGG